MRYLVAEMTLLLVAAFALGVAVGALLGRAQRRPGDQTPLETEVARLRALLRDNGIDPDPAPEVDATTLGELEQPTLLELEPVDPDESP